MVSRWGVRGAPAVHEGVVYFAAGIYPTMGTYLYAVDAETGETLAHYSLDSPPVFDGLIVADGRVFLAAGPGFFVVGTEPSSFSRTIFLPLLER